MGMLSLAPLCVTGLRLEGGTLFLEAEGEDETAACASCQMASSRVQARYRRFPLDLPWRGFVVRLAVRVRRFRCANEACPRRTFAEEFGAGLGRRRRFTGVVQAILADVAVAVGGRAGAWLAERQGAPDATQVADRFHLAKNVSDALDDVIKGRPWALPAAEEHGAAGSPGDASGEPSAPARDDDRLPPTKSLSPTEQKSAERRAARAARWQRVRELRAQGGSLRSIAAAVGINKATVQHLLRCDEPPSKVGVHPRPGGITSPKLAPYTAGTHRSGCCNDVGRKAVPTAASSFAR
ncbi:MAG TPA: transposase family protein [Chloroflexota bacterium]|nr:transposase family protein [Chloroflexota bacterium]